MAFLRTAKSWISHVNAPEDPGKFVGRAVKITDDETGRERVVEIESLQGNIANPTKFQVNTIFEGRSRSFLISMLDFYAQMNGETVSKEEIELFEKSFEDVKIVRQGWRNQNGLRVPNSLKPRKDR